MEKKKKGKLLWIVGIVAFLFIGCAALGGSDEPAEEKEAVAETETPVEETTEPEVSKVEEEVVEEPAAENDSDVVEETKEEPSEESSGDYLEIGDSFGKDDIFKATITDINIFCYDRSYIEYYVVVSTEIESFSDEEATFDQSSNDFYIDDYQYEANFNILAETFPNGDDKIYSIDLRPGKKCKFNLFAALPDEALDASKVEFAIGNMSVLLKDNGEWVCNNPFTQNNQPSSISGGSVVYGDYACSSKSNTAEVYFESDSGDDYIFINCHEGGPGFSCGFIDAGDGTYIARYEDEFKDDYSIELRIIFGDGTMDVEYVSSTGLDFDAEVFCGHYELESELDMNAVS